MIKRSDTSRIAAGATCGVLAFATFTITVGAAILVNPWFIWTDMALSDLGVIGPNTYVFRIGMFLTGVFTIGFGIGLEEYLKKKAIVAAKGFIIAGLAMMGIAIFPEGGTHMFFVCFMLMAFAIALITLSLRYDDWQYATLSGAMLAIALSSVFLFMFVTGVALAEAVIFFAVGILVLAYAARMNKDTNGGMSWKNLNLNLNLKK